MQIPIQATPYIRFVKRLFSSRGSLSAVAYRQDILCPQEKENLRPAIFLPGQLEKVTDRVPNPWVRTTKEAEIAHTLMTTVTYAPTIAYHIKNAVLFDGSIYANYFRHPIAEKSLFVAAAHEQHDIKIGALASSYLGTRFFGHWLADDCTKYFLAEEFGKPVCVRMSAYGDQQNYQSYFGQDWAPVDRARIEQLVVFQDFSQNSLKRKRYQILRDRIKAHVPENGSKSYVYLRRGQTGTLRTIQNEEEILSALTKRNFLVLDIASDRLEHIIGTLLTAKIVVSVEGSHIQHATLTVPENSGLLMLEPPDHYSAFQRAWAEALGVRYGFVVGSFAESGYNYSVSEILTTIDLLLNKIENSA